MDYTPVALSPPEPFKAFIISACKIMKCRGATAMAARVDWQKPKKLVNIFTNGFDFISISASSSDLNSFSSIGNVSF